jgi:hypothetical protein
MMMEVIGTVSDAPSEGKPMLGIRVGNQSTTSTVLINMLTSIHVNVNPRDMLLGNQSIHGWGLVD